MFDQQCIRNYKYISVIRTYKLSFQYVDKVVRKHEQIKITSMANLMKRFSWKQQPNSLMILTENPN